MIPALHEANTHHTPESLFEVTRSEPGALLLRSSLFDPLHGRYSFLASRPMLVFRSFGSRCEVRTGARLARHFGNPWLLLERLLERFELVDEVDLPFPLGGAFGFFGYDLRHFVESGLPQRARRDLDLPDCHLGFYESLVVFDHHLGRTWIIATGLRPDGSRDPSLARRQLGAWRARLATGAPLNSASGTSGPVCPTPPSALRSNLSRSEFLSCVNRAQRYIRAGHIYQVNLAQRFQAGWTLSPWALYRRLAERSPSPFAAYLDCGAFQIISSSPELFLRLSGSHVVTRPIKGTRPRAADPTRDTQLAYELQSSPKELAELVMITDLLRNDLGRICEFGSVETSELARLERFAHVQHLVSTIQGRLRSGHGHTGALAACFPGGSITGAPKIRAMAIIDDLEPVARGPYTGALGYVGFNRESQLSILIRAAICQSQTAYFHAGAGIVADSDPEFEYQETLDKARGFFEAIQGPARLAEPHTSSADRNLNEVSPPLIR